MLTREQRSMSEFLKESRSLIELGRDDQSSGFGAIADSIVHSVAFFGLSELHFRHAERCSVLDIQAERGKSSAQIGGQTNEKGLRTLSQAHAAIAHFREQSAKFPNKKPSKKAFETFQDEVRQQIAELEIKASDATKINVLLGEAVSKVTDGGTAALSDYLEEQIGKLDKTRRQQNRGAVDNIPIWKAIAIAIFFGIALWALFKCSFGWFGGCSVAEGAAYAVAGGIAAAIARFC